MRRKNFFTNSFIKQNVILSYFEQAFIFVATVLTGSCNWLQSLFLTDLIKKFQFSQINFPTNLFEIFKHITKSTYIILLISVYCFWRWKCHSWPYFIDNVGEGIARILVIFVISLVMSLLFEKFKIKTFFCMKILKYIRDFFIWQFILCFCLESLIVIFFFLALNILLVFSTFVFDILFFSLWFFCWYRYIASLQRKLMKI